MTGVQTCALPISATFTFVHASDTHIAPASAERTRRLRAIADSIRPAFVLVTGDLVKDALRVGEAEARGYYDLFAAEIASFRSPVYTVPGNHENFGIERAQSKVQATHPLYGQEMYRSYRGPDYYSFTYGGVHFVGLNTVDIDDQWYYGHVDARQLEWLARDLAVIPSTMPVVTFDHIPFFSAMETVNGYNDGPPAPSVITVNGKSAFRHTVSNARDVIAAISTWGCCASSRSSSTPVYPVPPTMPALIMCRPECPFKQKAARRRLSCRSGSRRVAPGGKSALGELLAPPRLVQTDLLSLHFARIARYQARLLQARLQRGVVFDQRARNTVAYRAGLTGFTAANHIHPNIKTF